MKLHKRFSGIKNRRKHSVQCWTLQLRQVLLFGIAALALSACGGSSDVSDSDSSTALTNKTIANALYFDKRTPAGFYKEDFQDDVFYSVSHVKNTSLLPAVERPGVIVHELASDDFDEAMTWSDKAAEYQPSYQQLAANTETMLYFQFTRFDPALPQFINMHRVFKANVLDRSGVDRSDEDARYKGRITMPNVTIDEVKLIIEYLWTFTLSNNYRNAVLESYVTETDIAFIHIMKQARLTPDSEGACDGVEVHEIRYRIPKDSGFIWKEKILIDSFSAKRTGNYLEIC